MKKLNKLIARSESLIEVNEMTARRTNAEGRAGKWTFFSLKNSENRSGGSKWINGSLTSHHVRLLALSELRCEKSFAVEEALQLKGYSSDEIRNWGWVVNYDEYENLLGVLDVTVDPLLLAACIACKMRERIVAIEMGVETGLSKFTHFDSEGTAVGVFQVGGSSALEVTLISDGRSKKYLVKEDGFLKPKGA